MKYKQPLKIWSTLTRDCNVNDNLSDKRVLSRCRYCSSDESISSVLKNNDQPNDSMLNFTTTTKTALHLSSIIKSHVHEMILSRWEHLRYLLSKIISDCMCFVGFWICLLWQQTTQLFIKCNCWGLSALPSHTAVK